MNTRIQALMYLFTPEDTTEQSGSRQTAAAGYGEGPVQGLLKTLFWLFFAVVLALLIGQLC